MEQIEQLVEQIKINLENDAYTGVVMLTHCAIDTMAFLSMPSGKTRSTRSDFIKWVDKYMKVGSEQPYEGIDIYGARCGIVHSYSAESDLSKNDKCKVVGYVVGKGCHVYKPDVDSDLMILDVTVFVHDFIDAVTRFLEDIEKSKELKGLVEGRLPKLFRIQSA